MNGSAFVERTFQLTPRIGPWRERDLYARDLETWAAFEAAAHAGTVLSEALDAQLLDSITHARTALTQGDLAGLASQIRASEHWRLAPCFVGQTAFLDIEADGESVPTVVGVMDGDGLATFRRGANLDQLPERLSRSGIWVTYNGASYDLPILRAFFESLPGPVVHLDLKPIARRAGLTGGLKAIEDQLGLSRPQHLRGLKGLDAIRLWRHYGETQELAALRLLTEYNLYDAINLRSVLEWSQQRLAEMYCWHTARSPIFERGDVLYDLSQLLLALR